MNSPLSTRASAQTCRGRRLVSHLTMRTGVQRCVLYMPRPLPHRTAIHLCVRCNHTIVDLISRCRSMQGPPYKSVTMRLNSLEIGYQLREVAFSTIGTLKPRSTQCATGRPLSDSGIENRYCYLRGVELDVALAGKV